AGHVEPGQVVAVTCSALAAVQVQEPRPGHAAPPAGSAQVTVGCPSLVCFSAALSMAAAGPGPSSQPPPARQRAVAVRAAAEGAAGTGWGLAAGGRLPAAAGRAAGRRRSFAWALRAALAAFLHSSPASAVEPPGAAFESGAAPVRACPAGSAESRTALPAP